MARPRRVELLTSRSVVWQKIFWRNKTEKLQEIQNEELQFLIVKGIKRHTYFKAAERRI